MPKQHPNMADKLVNMVPKWAQVGAILGSKIVLGASKSEKNDTENGTGIKLEIHTLREPRRAATPPQNGLPRGAGGLLS